MSTPGESRRESDRLPALRRMAWLMDDSIRLPGGYRIGIDGLAGLIPGIGDLLTAGVSGYILLEAARMKLPVSVLLRVGLNVAVDMLFGAIPIFGDIFDFAFKANQRNVNLIADYSSEPQRTRKQSRWVVAALLVGLGLLLAGLVVLLVKLAALIWAAVAA